MFCFKYISYYFSFILIFTYGSLAAQQKSDMQLLVEKTYPLSYAGQNKGIVKQKLRYSGANPFKAVSTSLLWVYKNFFSEQIMADCGFEPSCSSFASRAIKEHNMLLALFLTADRLTRCNGKEQFESESYLVNKKTGKLRDEPSMYHFH